MQLTSEIQLSNAPVRVKVPARARIRRVVSTWAWTVTLVWALALCGAGAARGDSTPTPDSTTTGWDGYDEFVALLRMEASGAGSQADVRISRSLEWRALEPTDVLILVHPVDSLSPERAFEFMRHGGALAVLDDFGRGDELLAPFGVRRLPPPIQPMRSLRHRPEFAIAESASDPAAGIDAHPLSEGIGSVVTNHPSVLESSKLAPILRIPGEQGEPGIIALAGVVGEGRLLAISDPSIFTNQMLTFPGNRAFARRVARYLGDGGSGKRARRIVLLFDDFIEVDPIGIRRRWSAWLPRGDVRHEITRLRVDGLPTPVALALALVGVGVAASIAWSFAIRPFRSPGIRFAQHVPTVAQGGWAGRVAVLAASTTPISLVMLELLRGLHDQLARLAGLGHEASAEAVVEAATGQRLLRPAEVARVREWMLEMRTLEGAIVSGRAHRRSLQDLEGCHAEVASLLQSARSALIENGTSH